MTMPETLKPDELVAVAWLWPDAGGRLNVTLNDPKWDAEYVAFMEAVPLALQSDLERVTRERDEALAVLEGVDAMATRMLEAERTRALTAEAALVKARTALEKIEHLSRHTDFTIHTACALALSAGEEEK